MQSVSSKIWICVAVSISYDDNHYTRGTSYFINVQQCIEKLHINLTSLLLNQNVNIDVKPSH